VYTGRLVRELQAATYFLDQNCHAEFLNKMMATTTSSGLLDFVPYDFVPYDAERE